MKELMKDLIGLFLGISFFIGIIAISSLLVYGLLSLNNDLNLIALSWLK